MENEHAEASRNDWLQLRLVTKTTNNQGINGYVASLAAGFTLKAVQTAFGSSWFGASHVDLIASDQNTWDQFWNKMLPLQRIMDEASDVTKIGFERSPLEVIVSV